jgi:internalin A
MSIQKSLAQQLIEESLESKNPELDLGFCGLTDDAPELKLLSQCVHVKKLKMGNAFFNKRREKGIKNKFSNIPPDLPQALEHLDISNNQIQEIKGLDKLQNLSQLDLSSNQIQEIKGLDDLKNLSLLLLSSNQIQEIKGLDKLQNLSVLLLSSNQIQEIKGLDNLKNLSLLLLSYNQIQEIKGLDNLQNLSQLDLSYNQIQEIKGLDNLQNLSQLYFYSNQIQEIKGLDNLQNLSKLYLSSNQIQEIKGLDNLQNLSKLYLSNNQIQEINNLSIELLKRLDLIELSDNALENKLNLSDINNPKVLLGYLQSQKKKRTIQIIPNTHIKINIIGSGRIGKTQFLEFLTENKYVENAPSTHGMNYKRYSIPKTTYEAVVWDFGGQDYHHGTHILFLRPKDFNIVLWRNHSLDAKYAYWLGTSRYFAPIVQPKKEENVVKPKLLLVQSVWSSDNDPIAYPDSSKIHKYQVEADDIFNVDVKAAFEKDKTWRKKWSVFKDYLDASIKAYASSFHKIPENFIPIRERLLDEPIKEINYDRSSFLEKYAADIEENMQDYLIDYLETSGCLLYFGKHEIPGLEHYIFPNPVELSRWIYNDVLTKEKGYRFGMSDLIKSIGKEQTRTLLLLSEHFNLFFRDKHQEEEAYVIPQFLPENDNSFKTVILDLLPFTFSLQFPDFMHQGRFFEFMSVYGEHATDDTSYWKYGLLFQHPKTGLQTLVYYEKNQQRIHVHIQEGKGKTEVARELFNIFAFRKAYYLISDKDVTSQRSEEDIAEKSKAIKDFKIQISKEGRHKELLATDGLISTNNKNYFAISDTYKNIQSKFHYGVCLQSGKRIALDFMTLNLLSNDISKKLRLFVSYSHKDEQYRIELENHFALLKRSGRIETWFDRKILPGDDWNDEIQKNLELADIVLLFLSSDFFASDYIWEKELGVLRNRLKKGEQFRVVPVFVRPCDLSDFDEMKFQGATKDDKGKTQWIATAQSRDEVYTEIVQTVRKVIEEMK